MNEEIDDSETIEDIVSEMRVRKDCKDWSKHCSVVLDLAGRIKKAHSRECEGLKEERNRAGLVEREKCTSLLEDKNQEIKWLRSALRNSASVMDAICPLIVKHVDPSELDGGVRESIEMWLLKRGGVADGEENR